MKTAPSQSRTSLVLATQALMLLLFVIASAICLRVFAGVYRVSNESCAADRALTIVQSAAESVKAAHGRDLASFEACFDADFSPTDTDGCYSLCIEPIPSQESLLGKADVSMKDAEGNTVYSVVVAWQEVDPIG